MTLTPGPRLGIYEITAAIGEGGMRQVFRARDTKLDRDVATKILREASAQDTDRLVRFTREVKILASLNHSNIAAVYGLEESGMTSLVMEIVEVDAMARSDERDAGASASSSEQSEASRKRDTVSDEAFIDRRALLPANETVEQKPFGGVKPCPTKGCGGEMR